MQRGPLLEGTRLEGALQEGTLQEGTLQEGILREGTLQEDNQYPFNQQERPTGGVGGSLPVPLPPPRRERGPPPLGCSVLAGMGG